MLQRLEIFLFYIVYVAFCYQFIEIEWLHSGSMCFYCSMKGMKRFISVKNKQHAMHIQEQYKRKIRRENFAFLREIAKSINDMLGVFEDMLIHLQEVLSKI